MQPAEKLEYLAHSCYQSNRIDTGSYLVQYNSRDWSDILENISLIYGKENKIFEQIIC